MKFSLSNIALTEYCHERELAMVGDLGFHGVEVAPSRVWKNTGPALSTKDIEHYRTRVELAGLSVVGLHSLFFDQPELGLFTRGGVRVKTLDYLVHLSEVCRDLGGKTLIYGGGRWRGGVSETQAFSVAVEFMNELVEKIRYHGTIFCFEPLSKHDSDFINSVYDSIELVKAVNSKSLRVQLDAKALLDNNELNSEVFEAARPFLTHVHVNEPDLGVLGNPGKVNHKIMGAFLRDIDYQGYVSLEQKKLYKNTTIRPIEESMKMLKKFY